MYYFKVQAHNEVDAGPYTKFINVSTTHENPVPLLCFTSTSGVRILDIDLQIEFKLDEYGTYEDIAYSALEHKFYGITNNETWMLMTWDFNASTIGTKPNLVKIADLDGPAYSLCIDWVARNLYWIYSTNIIIKLDLTLLQMGKVKYDNILKINGHSTSLNVLPSKGYM
ncbi:proto-oncogene tyrosine-protein kinase ros [Lasius niger]|uniref:Proto-oncogene tyrosine-protein kinase ros n=1 Tax=Lasius niger TaxID=67767 RepID=A0A0J7MXR2_LASNI|nr:proto-oncogene tyrosine-protein kinase ros [Lasius niger]